MLVGLTTRAPCQYRRWRMRPTNIALQFCQTARFWAALRRRENRETKSPSWSSQKMEMLRIRNSRFLGSFFVTKTSILLINSRRHPVGPTVPQQEQPERWNQDVNHGLLMMASYLLVQAVLYHLQPTLLTPPTVRTVDGMNEYCAVILIAIEFVSI